MRRWLTLLAIIVVGLGLAGPALAGKRVALIVANGDYKGAPLNNPATDAGIVAASLGTIGFEVTVVKNADLDAFHAALNAFTETAEGADVALFYFVGHGFTVNGGVKPVSVLMSTSADVTANSEPAPRAGGLPLDDIASSLVGRAKVTLIFVDAWRGDLQIVPAIGEKGRGFAVVDPARSGSLFVGLSTRLGGTAQDGEAGKGSPFARAFAAKIQGRGLRIDDMFRQVREAVKLETGGAQLPDVVQDDLPNGAITLVGPAEPAKTVATLDTGGGARSDSAVRALLAECDRLAASPYDRTLPAGFAGVEADKIDAAQAIPACRAAIAASPDDVRVTFELARALGKAGGADAEAFALYRQAAEADNAVAMNNLGNMYLHGAGVAKDEVEATKWFRRAADAGVAVGMSNLGRMYESGVGVPKDLKEAARWYQKAADAGYPDGMTNLAVMYQNGSGVSKDPAEAARWFRKAADAGDPRGMNYLGVIYESGNGAPKDDAEAARWYRKAAEAGFAVAKTNLGLEYENGRGVAKDPAEAARWFRLAAEAGDYRGMVKLGLDYQNGSGVPKDPSEAARWYQKAAGAGNADAMNNMGVLYGLGQGFSKDVSEAARWYKKAAEAGSSIGMYNLANFYEHGIGVPKDFAEAARWYQKAADLGQADAKLGLKRVTSSKR
jgi:TPR repeat protein